MSNGHWQMSRKSFEVQWPRYLPLLSLPTQVNVLKDVFVIYMNMFLFLFIPLISQFLDNAMLVTDILYRSVFITTERYLTASSFSSEQSPKSFLVWTAHNLFIWLPTDRRLHHFWDRILQQPWDTANIYISFCIYADIYSNIPKRGCWVKLYVFITLVDITKLPK